MYDYTNISYWYKLISISYSIYYERNNIRYDLIVFKFWCTRCVTYRCMRVLYNIVACISVYLLVGHNNIQILIEWPNFIGLPYIGSLTDAHNIIQFAILFPDKQRLSTVNSIILVLSKTSNIDDSLARFALNV